MRERTAIPMIWMLLCACAPMQSGVSETQKPTSQWDKADDLRFWLEIDGKRFAPSSPIPIRLHVAQEDTGDVKPSRLLAGRFVFTFVSADARGGVSVHASQQSFSGGGGVDYTGKTGMDLELEAPSLPGRYWVHVTVQSTPEDVHNFLRMAKVSAAAGPWWIGNRSTIPLPVEIFEAR